MLAERSNQQETISTGVHVTSECQKTRSGWDRELVTQRGDVPDHGAVVARVRHEQDGSLRPEIALLGSQPTSDGLDVVEACLGFDDGVDVSADGDAISTSRVAGEWHRDLGPQPDRRGESCGEPREQRDVPLVANGWPERMNAEVQLPAEHGRHPRQEIDVNAWSETRLDPADLRVRDAEDPTDPTGACACSYPELTKLLSKPTKQIRCAPSTALRGRLPGRHATELGSRLLSGAYLRLEHPHVPTDRREARQTLPRRENVRFAGQMERQRRSNRPVNAVLSRLAGHLEHRDVPVTSG